MVKLIGIILLATSLLALIAGLAIGAKSETQTTGNVVSNLIEQPDVTLDSFYYMQAGLFSYSIVSLAVGMLFLTRF